MKTSLSKSVKKGAVILGSSILSVYSMWAMLSNTTNANAAGPCIVTIFGKQYDVAPLQTGHTGGNVFTCGTDMTNVYQGMHGTDVSKIASLLVATPTPTPTPVVTPTPTPVVTPTPSVTPTPTPSPTPSPTVTPSPSITPTPTPTPTGAVVSHHDDSDEDKHEDHQGRRDDEDEKDEHKSGGGRHQYSNSDKNEDHQNDRDGDD